MSVTMATTLTHTHTHTHSHTHTYTHTKIHTHIHTLRLDICTLPGTDEIPSAKHAFNTTHRRAPVLLGAQLTHGPLLLDLGGNPLGTSGTLQVCVCLCVCVYVCVYMYVCVSCTWGSCRCRYVFCVCAGTLILSPASFIGNTVLRLVVLRVNK